jgi:hypothetical protein
MCLKNINIDMFDFVKRIGCLCSKDPLSAELNPICRLLALFGAHCVLYVSRIRVNIVHGQFLYVAHVIRNL